MKNRLPREDGVCLTTILAEIKALTNACKLQLDVNQHEVCLSSLLLRLFHFIYVEKNIFYLFSKIDCFVNAI